MRLPAAFLVVILTAGCATPPPTVKIPVAVPCVPAGTPRAPGITASATLRAMGDEELVLTIAAERLELASYAAQADAVITACR